MSAKLSPEGQELIRVAVALESIEGWPARIAFAQEHLSNPAHVGFALQGENRARMVAPYLHTLTTRTTEIPAWIMEAQKR